MTLIILGFLSCKKKNQENSEIKSNDVEKVLDRTILVKELHFNSKFEYVQSEKGSRAIEFRQFIAKQMSNVK